MGRIKELQTFEGIRRKLGFPLRIKIVFVILIDRRKLDGKMKFRVVSVKRTRFCTRKPSVNKEEKELLARNPSTQQDEQTND